MSLHTKGAQDETAVVIGESRVFIIMEIQCSSLSMNVMIAWKSLHTKVSSEIFMESLDSNTMAANLRDSLVSSTGDIVHWITEDVLLKLGDEVLVK